MKIKIDGFINGDTPILKGTSSDKTIPMTIEKVELIFAQDLPFESEDDRYQLELKNGEDDFKWTPNKTSLKTIIAAWGDESDAWIGKTIGMFTIEQSVAGKIKKIPYCKI